MKSKILNVRASSLPHFAFERWRIPALPIEQFPIYNIVYKKKCF
jgi:hypothetical protein